MRLSRLLLVLACAHVAVARSVPGLGDRCVAQRTMRGACADGLACRAVAGEFVCARALGEGEDCRNESTDDDSYGKGLYCDGGKAGGQCVEAKGVGEACSNYFDWYDLRAVFVVCRWRRGLSTFQRGVGLRGGLVRFLTCGIDARVVVLLYFVVFFCPAERLHDAVTLTLRLTRATPCASRSPS